MSSWLADEVVPGERRVLASAAGDEVVAYALPGRLVWRADGIWHQVPWDEMESASNDAATGLLRVITLAGVPIELTLRDSSALTQVVRERVEASILVQEQVRLGGGKVAVISARRPLEGDPEIVWRVRWPEGTLRNPYRELLVQQEQERLQAEYGF
jgi:hypothetical protein